MHKLCQLVGKIINSKHVKMMEKQKERYSFLPPLFNQIFIRLKISGFWWTTVLLNSANPKLI